MALEQRRILELISEGAISASEGAALLDTMQKGKREALFKLEISSRIQSAPLLEVSFSLEKLKEFIKPVMTMINSGLKVKFQRGGFLLNITELNWDAIFEMALDKEADNVYFIEEKVDDGDTVSLQIRIDK